MVAAAYGRTSEDDQVRARPDARTNPRLLDIQAVAALASYLALSWLFFGRGLVGSFSTAVIGKGPDPGLFVWLLAWWPHAIRNHLNPILTSAVFAPGGANIAWGLQDPLAMLLLMPLTIVSGPIVAHNVLMLMAPGLAGWATFVLCRHLARDFSPAWLGGYIFGFSPYMLGGMAGHEHAVLVFPLPLAAYVVLRRLAGEISARRMTAALAALIVIQAGCFIEGLATGAVVGGLALSLALLFGSPDARQRLWSLIVPMAEAWILGGIILLPLLYYMFAYGFERGVIFSPWLYSADLLGPIIPSPLNALGRIAALARIAALFRTNLFEAGAFISPPLLLVAGDYARSRWRTPQGRLICDLLIIACVLALGPWLQIAGRTTIGLPWLALSNLPLLNKALPARLSVYVFLILATIVALWFSSSALSARGKWVLASTIVLCGLPNLSANYWVRSVYLPPFFSTGTYRNYLRPGETVLVLPFGWQSESMLWQASTGMYFNLAGGYFGFAPLVTDEYAQWPIVVGMYNIAGVPDLAEQFKAFLASHSVGAIIVAGERYQLVKYDGGPTPDVPIRMPIGPIERRELGQLMSTLGIAPFEIGGIQLYRISPEMLAPYRQATALEMQQRVAQKRFATLLAATQNYLAHNRDPAQLTPQAIQRLGYAPLDWFGGKPFPAYSGSPSFETDSLLAATKDGLVRIGLAGSYAALAPIVDRYRSEAVAVYFPYPARSAAPVAPNRDAMLVMEFDRAHLARAAALAESIPERHREP